MEMRLFKKAIEKLVFWGLDYLSDGNIVEHAKRELSLAGFTGNDFLSTETTKNVVQICTIFSLQGHSGSSAPPISRLAFDCMNYRILTPLQGTSDEWFEFEDGTFQNIRASHVFKDKNGAYDIQ